MDKEKVKIQNKLMELYRKPAEYKFNKKEINFLKKHLPKSKYLVKYCIWKQKRHNGLYISFIIDRFPRRVRPCAADKSLDVICTREISEDEWVEELQNFGTHNRVMTAWDYDIVERLIMEDKKYGVNTPSKFVEHCKKLGYSGKLEDQEDQREEHVQGKLF